MNVSSRLPSALAVLVLAAAAFAPSAADAAFVTRQFEFSSTNGALTFGPTIGSFTYNDAIVPAGGGIVIGVGLLTDLNVSFASFSFDETTANSYFLRFDAGGDLLAATFGTDCDTDGCELAGGQSQWWIQVGKTGFSTNDFSYANFNGEQNSGRTFSNRLLPLTQVPEPASMALVAIALLGAAGAVRRRAR